MDLIPNKYREMKAETKCILKTLLSLTIMPCNQTFRQPYHGGRPKPNYKKKLQEFIYYQLFAPTFLTDKAIDTIKEHDIQLYEMISDQ